MTRAQSKHASAVALAIYQLPVRFVVASVCLDQHRQPLHHCYPVLAWEALAEDGTTDHEPLIHFDGQVQSLSSIFRFYDGCFELVQCNWPETEDAARLAEVFKAVEADALKRARRAERRAA